jgi:hypothetical protein
MRAELFALQSKAGEEKRSVTHRLALVINLGGGLIKRATALPHHQLELLYYV